MAKIGYLLLCEDVIGNQNEMSIHKPYVALSPLSIPGNYSFTIAFSLFDLKENSKYELKITMVTPSGTVVLNDNFEFEFTVPEGVTRKVPYGQMNIGFPNFPLREKGIYELTLMINDESSKTLEVPVIESNS